MSRKLTACVVGAGAGGGLSMKGLSCSEKFELVAISDLRPDALTKWKEKYPTVKTYTDHKLMFKECQADVACISTYAPSHKPLALDALAGLPLKGILVEKPLADTVRNGKDLLEAIKARKLPMATPHGLLLSAQGKEILARVHGGEIGELLSVEMQSRSWDLINAGIHWFNFFVALTRNDPIEYVLGAADTSTKTYRDGMQVETLMSTYVVTRSGIRGILNSGDYTNVKAPLNKPKVETLFRIVGAKGFIEFYGWDKAYYLLNAQHPTGQMLAATPSGIGGHQGHLENMAAMIEDPSKLDYTVPESSLLALEIVEAAYTSAMNGCAVYAPVASFVPPKSNGWKVGMPYGGTGGDRDGRTLPPLTTPAGTTR